MVSSIRFLGGWRGVDRARGTLRQRGPEEREGERSRDGDRRTDAETKSNRQVKKESEVRCGAQIPASQEVEGERSQSKASKSARLYQKNTKAKRLGCGSSGRALGGREFKPQ
jgi:hypothetical protein